MSKHKVITSRYSHVAGTPVCGDEDMPAVDFNLCAPDIRLSEIRRIFISKIGAAPFVDWTVAGEWNERMSPTSNDINAVRVLTVIGNKDIPTSTRVRLSMNRNKTVRKEHTVNATIDDVSETNHEFIRQMNGGRNFKMWYETEGGFMFGGNNGIAAHIDADMVLARGRDEIMTYVLEAWWQNVRTEDRCLSPIFNQLEPVEVLTCDDITGLVNTDIGDSELSFAWDANDTGLYQIAYNTTGIEPTSWSITSENTATITRLDSGTVYYFFVRSYCSEGSTSDAVSVAVATLPALFLYRAGRSLGFIQYAIVGYSLKINGLDVEIPAVILRTTEQEDDYMAEYLNGTFKTANSLTGEFVISSDGDVSYMRADGEDVEIGTPAVVLTRVMGVKYKRTGGGVGRFIYSALAGLKMVVGWDVIKDLSVLTTYRHSINQTGQIAGYNYTADVDDANVLVFHNDLVQGVLTLNSPLKTISFNAATNMPSRCQQFKVTGNDSYETDAFSPLGPTVQMLTELDFSNNATLAKWAGGITPFTQAGKMNAIRFIYFQNCNMNQANIDLLVNEFYTFCWDGMPRSISFKCLPQLTGVTYGAASLAARTAMAPYVTFS